MSVFVKCLCKIEKVRCYAKLDENFKWTYANALCKIKLYIVYHEDYKYIQLFIQLMHKNYA